MTETETAIFVIIIVPALIGFGWSLRGIYERMSRL